MISSCSRDGSPSLGRGQATGRVDVPVDAVELATSFDYVDAALLHRSPQCVVRDELWTLRKFGNSWMMGLTCGLLLMGKGWI